MVTWPHLHFNLNHVRKFIGDVMDRNYDVIAAFSKNLFLRRPGEITFADIINIVTMFIKTIVKDSRKLRRIRNYIS